MHMADALLSPAVGLTMGAVSVAAIKVSVSKVRKSELSEKMVPIMGVAGAMVFAGQMINFAIPATGSSGHIGGGIMLAGLLGGVPAFLSITAVLIIQCLFFADGGLLALGCNIFNMGVVPCLIIYPLVFKPLLSKGIDLKRLSAASIASAVIGLELGAFCVVLQTVASGITVLPFGTFMGLMLPIHLVIGLVEGFVTAAVLCFIYKMRPEILHAAHHNTPYFGSQNLAPAKDGPAQGGGGSTKRVVVILAVVTVLVGGGLSLFASTHPDGLEWAIGKTTEQAFGVETGLETDGSFYESVAGVQNSTAFMPDYAFASDPENVGGTSVAGLVGAGITFVLAAATGLVIAKVKKRKSKCPT
ncbi:MAG: energy-coupling factor ABC transporter permease [Peptococcaceae bacterium]|nr:energy-coupling factor ABC transporter permease [Peptococcaceae bacterium]